MAKELRTGFSTGACAATVISAAYCSFVKKVPPYTPVYSTLFPDGKRHEMVLRGYKKGFAEVIKDGGDDPDCTNGAHIYASVERVQEIVGYNSAYVLEIGKATLILDAVEGIGLCTREGLPCEKGKWAINPGPLLMITENLRRCEFGQQPGIWRAELGVRGGESMAEKTLNGRLGIVGGISILGTTGYVKPYSHDAYEHSIEIQVQALKRSGGDELLFATGSRTGTGALKQLSHLNEESLILIGDFIAGALAFAEKWAIGKVTIACMPGKLCKYCSGYVNTHAHKTELQLSLVERVIHSLYPLQWKDLHSVPTIREALVGFSRDEQSSILRELVPLALEKLQPFAPTLTIEILLFHFDGSFIGTFKE